MSFESFISFFSPFIFSAAAVYITLFVLKLNTKIKPKKVAYVWLGVSVLYILIPYFSSLVSVLPYASFIISGVIVYLAARYYWKLPFDKSVIFAVTYAVLNVVSVIALGYLLAGVFRSPSPAPTTY